MPGDDSRSKIERPRPAVVRSAHYAGPVHAGVQRIKLLASIEVRSLQLISTLHDRCVTARSAAAWTTGASASKMESTGNRSRSGASYRPNDSGMQQYTCGPICSAPVKHSIPRA